jgi:hypothetical protein
MSILTRSRVIHSSGRILAEIAERAEYARFRVHRSQRDLSPKRRLRTLLCFWGVTKLKDIPRITASPRRPQGGGAMP